MTRFGRYLTTMRPRHTLSAIPLLVYRLRSLPAMAVKPIPDGYRVVTPYLIVKEAAAALDFYKRALGAEERMRLPMPDGRICHAELQLGDCVVMLADEFPEMGARSPSTLGGTPVGIMVYVKDVDAQFSQAVAAGGGGERAGAKQIFGGRLGEVFFSF